MENREIIELKLENAKLKHTNIQLQGMLLSRDLAALDVQIAEFSAELSADEGKKDEQV